MARREFAEFQEQVSGAGRKVVDRPLVTASVEGGDIPVEAVRMRQKQIQVMLLARETKIMFRHRRTRGVEFEPAHVHILSISEGTKYERCG